MIKERLYINNTYIPLSRELNPSITDSIKDVREPEKAKGSYSLTTKVPDSLEAREVFGQIFNVNLINGAFDPNVKADCLYLVGNLPMINGYCQLKEITRTDNYDVEYSIVMYGETSGLFSEIDGKYLHDLDLSRWNHPFTRDIQQYSWDTQIYDSDAAGFIPFSLGQGYVYPLIDYGFSQDGVTFRFDEIGCAIYVKEYWDAIFEAAGKSYESNFIDSDDFKGLIIPSSPELFQLTDAEITARKFSANTPNFTSTAGTTTNDLPLESYSSDDKLIFTNEVADPSGLYNDGTGVFTCSSAGWYNVSALIDLNATFSPNTQPAELTAEVRGKIKIIHTPNATSTPYTADEVSFFITRDNQVASSDWPYTTNTSPTYPDSDYLEQSQYSYYPPPITPPSFEPREFNPPDRYLINTPNIFLESGDEIHIAVSAGFFRGTEDSYFDSSIGTSISGDATLTCSIGAFYNGVSNTKLVEGNTLLIEKIIPKDIKQTDFILSIAKMFNLYFQPSKTDPNRYIIEPRDDYYGTTKRDIQAKISQDKGLKFIPMSELNAKRYLYTYKDDKDYWNEHYKTRHKRLYGDRQIDVLNEFVKGDHKTEIIFSPTPIVGLANNDRAIPTIVEKDDLNNPKSTKHNIRILYYGGLKDNFQTWNHQNDVYWFLQDNDPQTQYPYAGHWDDPFNPTLDINFGLVQEVFYDDVPTAINYTNNNLWNKFWSKFIGEITDKESKIVVAYVNMTPSDYYQWSFRDLYWFNNAYHRLNKKSGFKPVSAELTKCEFLKLKNVPDFTASEDGVLGSTDPIDGPKSDNLDTDEDSPVFGSIGSKSNMTGDSNQYNSKTQEVSGSGNFVSMGAKNVKIQGDGNAVFESENVEIQGDNNEVGSGLKNVTLINTSGVTVTESFVTYIDGKLHNGWTEETADFIVDDTVYGYYLDANSNDIQARLNGSESEFVFKRVDSSGNRCYVDAGSFRIDNDSSEFDLLENESIRLRWNADDQTYYIIN